MIFGSDVSHFDNPDTRAMFGQGIVFQTHKAGGDANDGELGAWWNFVKNIPGVLLGAYWVLYPGNPVGRANLFLSRLDSQCPGWRDRPFILQADCEQWGGDPATVPSIAEINAFCDRLVERAPKLNPIVYAPKWVYGNRVSGLRYPIWASAYVTGAGSFQALYPGDGAKQWAAYGGRGPSILQYTSSATIGGQTTCDANAFRGTLEQLTRLVAPGWSTVATLDSDDKAYLKGLLDSYLGFDANQSDGTPTSRIGRLVWTQGIPDGTVTDNSRRLAYQALQNLGTVALLAAEPSTVDPAAVASALIAAGIGVDVAQAIIAQLSRPAS